MELFILVDEVEQAPPQPAVVPENDEGPPPLGEEGNPAPAGEL